MDISSATPVALYSNVQRTTGPVNPTPAAEDNLKTASVSAPASDLVTIRSTGQTNPVIPAGKAEQLSVEEALNERLPESLSAAEEAEETILRAGQEDTQVRNGRELTQEQVSVLDQMVARDREVRAHEQAHAAVGGQYAGAPSFDYQRGPDGRLYAAGGEVSIDTGAISGDPQATIAKMQVVMQAASAPAEPSGQDRRVAAQAAAILSEAQAELAQMKEEERAAELEAAEEARDVEKAEQAEKDKEDTRPESDRSPESRLPESMQPDLVSSLAQLTEAQISLDRHLVEMGVYSKAFPEGVLISNIA